MCHGAGNWVSYYNEIRISASAHRGNFTSSTCENRSPPTLFTRIYRRVYIRATLFHVCTREFAIWTIYADVIPFVEAPKLTRIRYTRGARWVCPSPVWRHPHSWLPCHTRSLVRDSYTSSFSQPRRYGFVRFHREDRIFIDAKGVDRFI